MTQPAAQPTLRIIETHDLRRWARFTNGDGSLDYLRCPCGFITKEDSNDAMFAHIAESLAAQPSPDALRSMLERLQWSDHAPNGTAVCPVCDCMEKQGHECDCRLAVLLAGGDK